nr:RNA-dependent RNA polymerase [Flumine botourmiavirus 1]
MHNLVYPSGELMQSNGQLMGSLSSFNNLSMINSALFEYVRMYRPDDFSDWHFVNGDDILFTATPEGLAYWKLVTSSCGLVPSFGKNYYSSRFYTINSEFYIDGMQIPYINWALVSKQVATDSREIGEKSEERNSSNLGTLYRSLCQRAQIPLNSISRIRKVFISTHRDALNKSGRSLLLPCLYNGLGAMTASESFSEGLKLDVHMIRDISHPLRTRGSGDSVSLSARAIEDCVNIIPREYNQPQPTYSGRSQFLFSGTDRDVVTKGAKAPCRHCLGLRPYIGRPITHNLTRLIRELHDKNSKQRTVNAILVN